MGVIEIKHLYPEAQPEIVTGDIFHVGEGCYLQIVSNGASFNLLDLSHSDVLSITFESISDIISHVTVTYGGFELIRRHNISITLKGNKRTFEI